MNKLRLIISFGLLAMFWMSVSTPSNAQPPGGFPFGFEPGKKLFHEGIIFLNGPKKGEKGVLPTIVESSPKERCVVIWANKPDESVYKFAKMLEEKSPALKDYPMYVVLLFGDPKVVEEEGAKFKHVTMFQSWRKNPREWSILKLDPAVSIMAMLLENKHIQKRIDVKHGELTEAKAKEVLKEIEEFAPKVIEGVQTVLGGHPGGARRMRFSPDGKSLYSLGEDGESGGTSRLKKWELATGKELAMVKVADHGSYGLALNADASIVVTNASDATIRFWDAATFKELFTIKMPQLAYEISLSRDGKLVAAGCRDKMVRLYNVADKKEIAVLKGHEDRVQAVDFSPDGKLLVSGDELGKIKLWDVEAKKELATWPGHTNTVECLRFSADGKQVASGGREMRGITGPGKARIWDVATGKEVRDLEDATRVNGVLAISYVGDGKTLAIAGESPWVRLIDLTTGKEIDTLKGQQSAILSMATSPDGTIIAAGAWNGPIRFWKVGKGK